MSGITRRQAIGAASAVAGAAVVGVGAAQGPALAAGHGAEPGSFDEVYLGRRIQGGPAGGHGGHHADHGGGYSVRIDGDELHIMRNADGTWISVINHYDPQATPRALARAAVDDLQGAALVPLAPATR
ncbi:apotyrosinase chaperone MelC1 [Streptomyces sp. AN091965]|uniref:apotyrosinase chaperone MelC1 n=1 Tax=Streptomyces sp. AN091965 TaxID=2927803 RepID=UPI001F615671|nr:tyrosinase cofactor [Streptomyces sp. AN091965]MCI3930993.1 tyrosinase cofactor [Streptomyces sp. AN091965]